MHHPTDRAPRAAGRGIVLAAALLAAQGLGVGGAAGAAGPDEAFEIRPASGRVCDFPKEEDLSKPKSAYAAVNRVLVAGKTAGWIRVSTPQLARRMKGRNDNPPRSAESARRWLDAEIVEVLVFRGRTAMVVSRLAMPAGGPQRFDGRVLELHEGRWLNDHHGVYRSAARARESFARACSMKLAVGARPPVPRPAEYLKPFVRHVQRSGRPPREFVLEAIETHRLVIIGEIHHRPAYWALNADVVRDRRFAKAAGQVYLELPHHAQPLVDRFLASDKPDTAPIVEVLRDNLWMGWPDRPMLEFFVAVRQANRRRPAGERIRIVLVDMARPWAKVKHRGDWGRYNCDRDELMARLVLEDLGRNGGDRRGGLFIVGLGHTAKDLKLAVGQYPVRTAGWHLRRKLGGQLYTVLQHGPMMTNQGRVDGRACLGLFDSAFAKTGFEPVAFPLGGSPFGAEPFTAMPDLPTRGTYADAFDAYVVLKKLEDERFSPLIDGFYTDPFVKELDRRYRMMFGRSLVRGCGLARLDGECFVRWMGRSWGRPRRQWQAEALGPPDAWHHGGRNWVDAVRTQHHKLALAKPEILRKVAESGFEKIRRENYGKYLLDASLGWPMRTWQQFGPPYTVHSDYPAWVKWCCRTFKADPIAKVEVGAPLTGKDGRPAVPYKLTLRSGAVLEGRLPFEYQPRSRRWNGIEGMDWHRKHPKGLSPPGPAGRTETRPRQAAGKRPE